MSGPDLQQYILGVQERPMVESAHLSRNKVARQQQLACHLVVGDGWQQGCAGHTYSAAHHITAQRSYNTEKAPSQHSTALAV
jgi:hypothetical protein